MAKKSSGTTKDAATTKKAGKKAGVKKTAVKKAPKATAGTASKSGTPKAAAKKSSTKKGAVKGAAKKSAPKKASAPKLNDRMSAFIHRIHGAGEVGYAPGKGEDKTIAALGTRKLVKRGKKNADTGKHHYTLTKSGQKHVVGGGGSGTSPSTGGA